MKLHEDYLGDGVYVWFDDYQIWLKTDMDGQEHLIALEPEVYAKLLDYVRDLTIKNKEATQ